MSTNLELWCRDAGVKPAPRTTEALARGTGVCGRQTRRVVNGTANLLLVNAEKLASALRVDLGAIAYACRKAREREQARRRVAAVAKAAAER